MTEQLERADEATPPARERRSKSGERRDDRARHTLEMALDRLFSPGRWAARLADALHLQSARPVVVNRLLLPVTRVGARPPLRIAFATDFHAGTTTAPRVLTDACEALAAERPDLLLLGGDFVTARADNVHELAAALKSIPAPMGKFGVYGNHDLRAHRATVDRALRESGVRILVNESAVLPAPHDDITVIGLDDPIRGAPEATVMDDVGGVRVVLMHAPDGLLSIGDRDFDVAFCGHTHGGQITVGGFAPYLPAGELSRRYPTGLFRLGPHGRRPLVVSNGVGCSTLPIRVGATAEVHLITLG